MKNLIVFLSFILLANLCHGQAPELFNYQALARDSVGNPVANQTISVKFSILEATAQGSAVYAESHQLNTDNQGMFSAKIGSGNVQIGVFEDIEWGNAAHFLKIEIDLNGGNSYLLMGISQLLSVPYALYSQSVGHVAFNDSNVILGVSAGQNNTGTHNVIVGLNAGMNNEAANNTYVGMGSGQANTTGNKNVFLGSSAGLLNTTGHGNTFTGYYSGRQNTNGGGNTFVGVRTGTGNTSASYNTFIGNNAGAANTSGEKNTFLGTLSGRENISGHENTFLGHFSARSLNSGSKNTFLGSYSGEQASGSNNVFLGYGAGYSASGDDQLIIANAQDSAAAIMVGDFSSGDIEIRGELKTNTGIRYPDGTLQTSANPPGYAVPKGGIIMWSGSTPPEGWALCNGTNGTPDLRGRFIVGYDPDDNDYAQPGNLSEEGVLAGQSGGEKVHTLTKDEIPAHNHSGTTIAGGDHQHDYIDYYHYESHDNGPSIDGHGVHFAGGDALGAGNSDSDNRYLYYLEHATNANDGHHDHGIETAGGGQSHENRPPYYTLAFIMRQ